MTSYNQGYFDAYNDLSLYKEAIVIPRIRKLRMPRVSRRMLRRLKKARRMTKRRMFYLDHKIWRFMQGYATSLGY